MANPILTAPQFQNEEAAFAFVEAALWPDGPVCPHCGGLNRISQMQGKSTRLGLYKCYQCRKPFTVRMKTIFESSHIPLHFWLQAIHLLCSSKKGISANQLHRTLGVTLKTAWFLGHRIREAMNSTSLSPMGGAGSIVESDETFIGRKQGLEVKQGYGHKNAVLTLVERGGSARSFHVERVSAKDIGPIVSENIARESRLMTDEANNYTKIGAHLASHHSVDHSRGEYG